MPQEEPSTAAPSTMVASTDSYEEALFVTGYLHDSGIQPGSLAVVGAGLRQLERPAGRPILRLTWSGVANGAWLGALVGILITVFAASPSSGFAVMFWSIVYGVLFGALRGFLQGLARSRPGAERWTSVVATRYEVLATPAEESIVRQLLARRSEAQAKSPDAARRRLTGEDTRAA